MKLSEAQTAEARRPTRAVVLEPTAFAPNWRHRPKKEVAIGIRPLSEQELLVAQSEAQKKAFENGRDGDAALLRYNEEVMIWAVGYAACDPNDALKPWFELADATVRVAMTPQGLRRLFDELEVAHIEDSPIRAEATAEEIQRFAARLGDGSLERVPRAKAHRIRKLVRWLLEEIEGA